MSKRPWFPLYVGDILADTMNFDSAQFGGYMKILCHYWMTEEPMSMDEMRVASGLSKNIFTKSWPLFSKKFVAKNEKYFNRRMKEEITKAIELSEIRSKAAVKSNQAKAPANDPASATQSQLQLHKEHSVNKLTGDDSPEIDEKEDTKKRLWRLAKQELKIKPTLVGKIIKQYGEHAVACAIEETVSKEPAEPTSFLLGLLKANPKTGSQPAWQRIPYDDEKLQAWATKHGFRTAHVGEEYEQYRAYLRSAVTLRKDKAT